MNFFKSWPEKKKKSWPVLFCTAVFFKLQGKARGAGWNSSFKDKDFQSGKSQKLTFNQELFTH